ncbi:MAG: serine hydrolase, partial [Lachnospiraceae bacterium]|nr:serine hydrolase [Lachnospiraceae bacterium]
MRRKTGKSMAKEIIAGMAALLLFANTSISVFASSDRLTPSGLALEDVGSKIEEWADENSDEYVSFAAAIFCKDDIVYQGAFGYADRENGIVADKDTVYEWGSATKTIVWVSV